MADWATAARSLLLCVTRPGGAGQLDDYSSRFVRACLGLDGSIGAMSTRINNLVHAGDYGYPTSMGTLIKMRRAAMDNLAAELLVLETYPCAWPGLIDSAVDQAADHVNIVMTRNLASLDEAERLDFYKRLMEKLRGIPVVNVQGAVIGGLYARFRFAIQLLAEGSYRRLVEDLEMGHYGHLVSPEFVPKLYSGESTPYDLKSEEVERTARVIYWIMEDTEKHELWLEAMRSTSKLSRKLETQRQRILEQFDTWAYAAE